MPQESPRPSPAKKSQPRSKRTPASLTPANAPLEGKKPAPKSAAKKKRPPSLAKPTSNSRWMAPSEDQKIKWGVRLLAALLLVVALTSGEIAWTGDGIKIGLHKSRLPQAGQRASAR